MKVGKSPLRRWRKLCDAAAGEFQRPGFILMLMNGRMCWVGRGIGRIIES